MNNPSDDDTESIKASENPKTNPEIDLEKGTIHLEQTTSRQTISLNIGTEDSADFTTEMNIQEEVQTEDNLLPEEIKKENINIDGQNVLKRPKNNICGVKGGKSVEEAYGKEASKYIMPLLIDSWVFGKDKSQKARFEDTESRIIGGKVTSTVLYCWVAAILTEENEFVCTGTLAADDLVITSGSCIHL